VPTEVQRDGSGGAAPRPLHTGVGSYPAESGDHTVDLAASHRAMHGVSSRGRVGLFTRVHTQATTESTRRKQKGQWGWSWGGRQSCLDSTRAIQRSLFTGWKMNLTTGPHIVSGTARREGDVWLVCGPHWQRSIVSQAGVEVVGRTEMLGPDRGEKSGLREE
jgi:hypothetical protein